MSHSGAGWLSDLLAAHESHLLESWLEQQKKSGVNRRDMIGDAELRDQSAEFLTLLGRGARRGTLDDIESGAWDDLRDLLGAISRSRSLQGYSPKDVAVFIFSFKQPLFELIRSEFGHDHNIVFERIWDASKLLDEFGYWTTEVFQKTREDVILRQQQELLELSTPVVKLWDGILALPMIGTLDSGRTQVVMESLLQQIVATGSEIAIIDITGVPTVDTLVAQHLLKTVAAARLMGADCIISGIRPQIAQTIVHLGVDLSAVITKATLADAFKLALQRSNLTVGKAPAKG